MLVEDADFHKSPFLDRIWVLDQARPDLASGTVLLSAIVSRLTFDDVATAYDDFMGRWTRLYVPALLRAAHVAPGQRVLDMATGTGESASMAADAVGARGTIVGVDVSLPMLRGALAKPGARPIRLAAMDGQALALRHEIFDTVISQLGLMFFPSRVAGVREARRVLRPGGRFAALVWGALEADAVVRRPCRRAPPAVSRAARGPVSRREPRSAGAPGERARRGRPAWRERDDRDADLPLRVVRSGGGAGALPPTITGATWSRARSGSG